METNEIALLDFLGPRDYKKAREKIEHAQQKKDAVPIQLHINSVGGVMCNEFFWLLEAIQQSNVTIIAIAKEQLHSVAAILFCVCQERFIFPGTKVLIHPPLINDLRVTSLSKDGKLPKEAFEQAVSALKRCREVIETRTHITSEDVALVFEAGNDMVFLAEDAIRAGIADSFYPGTAVKK